MTPIPFVLEQHYAQVHEWLAHWNEQLVPEGLPKTGFIIPGKAAGFLYRTDSSLALIENLVAAPGLSKEERNVALDAVVVAVCEEAARQGFKILMAYTLLDAVVKRAERLGFLYVSGNYHLLARPL